MRRVQIPSVPAEAEVRRESLALVWILASLVHNILIPVFFSMFAAVDRGARVSIDGAVCARLCATRLSAVGCALHLFLIGIDSVTVGRGRGASCLAGVTELRLLGTLRGSRFAHHTVYGIDGSLSRTGGFVSVAMKRRKQLRFYFSD